MICRGHGAIILTTKQNKAEDKTKEISYIATLNPLSPKPGALWDLGVQGSKFCAKDFEDFWSRRSFHVVALWGLGFGA